MGSSQCERGRHEQVYVRGGAWKAVYVCERRKLFHSSINLHGTWQCCTLHTLMSNDISVPAIGMLQQTSGEQAMVDSVCEQV